MHEDLLVGLAITLVLGVLAQWIAWRVKLPSILMLLILGIAVGPLTGILKVDEVFGDLLFPIVSLSVAIILFEGGLSLRLRDIRGSGGVVRNLIVVGVLITWALTSLLAYFILGFSVELSLLIGATLVVTGPTVIIPLLQQVRPSRRVSSILRWEGIVIDPVGAVLALLVFEEILLSEPTFSIQLAIGILLQTMLIGVIIGWAGAQFMVVLYSRFFVPDYLQNPVTLMVVVGAFTLSDLLQTDSGLLTVTLMGIIMANQRRFDVRHIVEFKENLQVLLVSVLFILLAARMTPSDIAAIGPATLLFVAIMVLVIRPISVWVSAIGSDLTFNEKLFIGWMAPRGIVAAAVASVFSLELAESGHPEAVQIVPITFSVIIGTVIVYSLTSGALARRLGLAQSNPQGLIIVGAPAWVRAIALELKAAGFRVLLTDTNPSHIASAREMGLEVYHGNVLSEITKDSLDLSGIGRLLAMTANDEVNTLACIDYKDTFGQANVYQLVPQGGKRGKTKVPRNLGGRYLFNEDMTYIDFVMNFGRTRYITTLPVNDVQTFEHRITDDVQPLFVISESGDLFIWSGEDMGRLRTGQRVVGLVDNEPVPAQTV